MFFLVVHKMFKRLPLAFPFFSSKLSFIIPLCDLPHFPPFHSSHAADLISQVPKSGPDSYFLQVGSLDTLLRAGYHIGTYAGSETNPDRHTAATHRLAQLQQQYTNKLPNTALLQWDTLLPTNKNNITPEAMKANLPRAIDIVIAGLLNYLPITQATRQANHPAENTLKNIVRLLHFLHSAQPTRIKYILANTPSAKLQPPMRLKGTQGNTHMPKHNTQHYNAPKLDQLPAPTITIN